MLEKKNVIFVEPLRYVNVIFEVSRMLQDDF
jgi:hypothetical protein